MPQDLLTCPLGDLPTTDGDTRLRTMRSSDRDDLAAAYQSAYPPEIGAANHAEALTEMDATFAGQYGVLRDDASFVALDGPRVVGAVMVTERSIWDEGLEGPFIIDLFVHADQKGRGFGAALVRAAMDACIRAGDNQLSLRVGEGSSPAAFALYRRLGFQ
ncbi:GNAT family N-acetyltransferase [Aestuariimicrobium ganziense]|uniref:GNAT family N-acetyltransferase n=1 Tax=Aestuariimicrobium ganziense TaxID=2773677 RepID=UPI0019456FAC|nr:GNAT family N-acetyltransferase [Aestuariimicrobium ganziense]